MRECVIVVDKVPGRPPRIHIRMLGLRHDDPFVPLFPRAFSHRRHRIYRKIENPRCYPPRLRMRRLTNPTRISAMLTFGFSPIPISSIQLFVASSSHGPQPFSIFTTTSRTPLIVTPILRDHQNVVLPRFRGHRLCAVPPASLRGVMSRCLPKSCGGESCTFGTNRGNSQCCIRVNNELLTPGTFVDLSFAESLRTRPSVNTAICSHAMYPL